MKRIKDGQKPNLLPKLTATVRHYNHWIWWCSEVSDQK